MLGAIIGDMVGSVYQGKAMKTKEFQIFNINNHMTDDSILTIEVAKVLMDHYPIKYDFDHVKKLQDDLIESFSNACLEEESAGWGASFYQWAHLPLSSKNPYNSYGNGAAMRISPVGWMAKSEDEVKRLSRIVTEITHDHLEGLKGAEAIAMCVYLALHGKSKQEIAEYVKEHYYPRIVALEYSALVSDYEFDVTCQGSVPEAIFCFLISTSFEDAIRTAISIGGDSDTIAAMTGSIAEVFYQKDQLSDLEDNFLYLFIDKDIETLIKDFHKVIGNTKIFTPTIQG